MSGRTGDQLSSTCGALNMRAKYDGICPFCQQPIRAGDQVFWRQGQTARHPACANKPLPDRRRK